MAHSVIIVTVLTILGAGRAAEAQEPVDLGGGIAFAGLADGRDFWGEGVRTIGGELHATLPVSPRFGLDIATTVGRRSTERQSYTAYDLGYKAEGGEVTRTEILYSVTVRQKLGWDGHSHSFAFAQYGLAGFVGTTSRTALQETFGNGSIYSSPAYTNTNTAFGFPLVGAGFQRALTSRLALRGDASVVCFLWIPAGFRASATFVVPLGR